MTSSQNKSHKNLGCEPSILVSLFIPGMIHFKSQPQSISFQSFECAYKHPLLTFVDNRIQKSIVTDSNWVGPVLWVLRVENICEMCWIMLQCCGKTILCFMNRKAFWENIKTFHSVRLAGFLWKEFGWIRTSRSCLFICQILISLSNLAVPHPDFQTSTKVKYAEIWHLTGKNTCKKHISNLTCYQWILQQWRGVLNV